MFSKERMKQIINETVNAVNESELGPLVNLQMSEDQVVKKAVNPVAFQVFAICLTENLKSAAQGMN